MLLTCTHSLLLAIAASPLGLAAPSPAEIAIKASVTADGTLRLIKTSETDPGTWVREDEKIEKYVAKGIRFIDITDITDEQVLARLSTSPEEAPVLAPAVTYPTTLSHQTEANALIANITESSQRTFLKTLTDYHNRYYRSTYGTAAATWLFHQVQSAAASNAAITTTQFAHSYAQPSIIARIPGTNTNATVIVSAHFDSTSGSATARSPGADDNGSGVAVLVEALRVLAAARFAPPTTLELHWYSGEEGGLLGSADVLTSYKAAARAVLALVNQDMAGFSPSRSVSVYTDYVDAGLTAYVRRVAGGYSGVAATTSDVCGYACSDHASAYANGFPAAYVCDEPMDTSDPYIHSSEDSYDTIQWDAIARHTKFTIGFLVEASYL